MSKYDKNIDSLKLSELMNEDTLQPKSIKVDKIIQPKYDNTVRDTTTIYKWRQAIYQAEKSEKEQSDYYYLQNIYRELYDNAIVYSVLQVRISRLLDKAFTIRKDGDEVENNLFKQRWFRDLVQYSIESEMFGFSCLGIGDITDIDNIEKTNIQTIDNVNRLYCNPKFDYIKTKMSVGYSNDGVLVTDNKYKDNYFYIKNNTDPNFLGIFHKIVPYFQRLKDSENDMANYISKFGVTPVIIKSDNNNAESNHNKAEFLKSLSSNSYGVIDANDEIQTLEISDSNSQAFLESTKYNSEQITKLIIGVKSLGEESAYVGSSEANERIMDSILKSDEQLVTDTINYMIIPRLIKLGVKWLDGCVFEYTEADSTDHELKLKQIDVLSKAGYEFDLEELSDLTGLTVTKKSNIDDTL